MEYTFVVHFYVSFNILYFYSSNCTPIIILANCANLQYFLCYVAVMQVKNDPWLV